MSTTFYTPEEQQQLLDEAAQALGFNCWSEYKAEHLDWDDEEWDD